MEIEFETASTEQHFEQILQLQPAEMETDAEMWRHALNAKLQYG